MNSNRIPRAVAIELKTIEAVGNNFSVTEKPYREDSVSVLVSPAQPFSGKEFAAQLLAHVHLFDSYLLSIRPREWTEEIDRLMSASHGEAPT